VLNWLFWQMGSTPYVGGGFGHFFAYAPVKIKYAIDRFAMEVKRLLDVLDRRLADNRFLAGDEYTIADMANWPWYGNGMLNGASYNDPRKFLSTHEYKNLTRWTKEIGERPAVKRGRMVNKATGPLEQQLHEQRARHPELAAFDGTNGFRADVGRICREQETLESIANDLLGERRASAIADEQHALVGPPFAQTRHRAGGKAGQPPLLEQQHVRRMFLQPWLELRWVGERTNKRDGITVGRQPC